jgi:hypothetical protein
MLVKTCLAKPSLQAKKKQNVNSALKNFFDIHLNKASFVLMSARTNVKGA